jgi:diguanylate cyclase (GGDEF)-like protein
MLSTLGRGAIFALASLAAIPAVIAGLGRVDPGHRRPWWLLLAAMVTVSVANIVRLASGEASATSRLLDAAGNLLALAAACALVVRRGRNDLGRIIDASIIAAAVGGLLWDMALLPHLQGDYTTTTAQIDLFVVVFALCGVLGALARLARVAGRSNSALWWLRSAAALALVGNTVLALANDHWLRSVAMMMFIATYASIGLFGLDSSAALLARPEPLPHEDALSLGRLVFLGAAVAVIPTVVGIRALMTGGDDALLLTIGGPGIAILVMARIGQLSAERDRAEQALRHEASHDPLTDLPNRREFIARLGAQLSIHPDCVIAFCDLDGFKAVNDRLGHDAGDQLLVEVARRLRACVRNGDVVSRFGGDEFVILARGATPRQIDAICQRIVEALSRPIILRGEHVTIGASIGIAAAVTHDDPDDLIKRADHAMYSAKLDDPDTSGIRVIRA